MKNVSQDAASSTAGGYLLHIYGEHLNNSDARVRSELICFFINLAG